MAMAAACQARSRDAFSLCRLIVGTLGVYPSMDASCIWHKIAQMSRCKVTAAAGSDHSPAGAVGSPDRDGLCRDSQ